jgi:hypothetical protein
MQKNLEFQLTPMFTAGAKGAKVFFGLEPLIFTDLKKEKERRNEGAERWKNPEVGEQKSEVSKRRVEHGARSMEQRTDDSKRQRIDY